MSDTPSQQILKEQMRNWSRPDTAIKPLQAGLYLIATPIGNLRDISLRALDTLAIVDAIYCEDTRVTGKLLNVYAIKKPLAIYNDHSDESVREAMAARIRGGEALALVSDAGMPLISDPGYKLVHMLREAGLMVTSLPGASATLAGLQLSGMPTNSFSFIGFLPAKSASRQSFLTSWVRVPSALVAFETGPRLIAALEDIAKVMGGRRVAVTRELTKLYEDVQTGSAAELLVYYQKKSAPKGEIVLVIAPPEDITYSDTDLKGLLVCALEDMSTKDAAAYVAAQTGAAKKTLYDLALKVARGDKAGRNG